MTRTANEPRPAAAVVPRGCVGLVALFSLCLALSSPCLARDSFRDLVLRIAELGNAATVGIYCKRGAYENYFGTGAVISPDGYILTSTTVVPEGAEDIRVFFTNHTWKPARVVETNEHVESTLLKVEGEALPAFPVCAALPGIGEPAFSFGNANNMIRLGENAAFSAGVISGIYGVRRSERQSSYEGLAIESDAAINPGQDGGPLCNVRGELVGIVSLSFSPSRWQGTAVPMRRILEELKTLREGTVALSRKPPVDRPGNTASLRERIEPYVRALVPIKVRRTHPPEKLPSASWARFTAGLEGKPEAEARRYVREFLTVDRLLVANAQLRRPGGWVTGLIVSPDGYILTSRFNVGEDVVFVHGKRGLITYTLGGDYRKSLFPYPPREYRRERNKVVAVTVRLPGGREVPARVVAGHVPLGVALLKVEADGLPYVDVARAAGVPSEGKPVMVLGVAPGGDTEGGRNFTLNTGIVSTAARRMGYLFQFDAILNYGNSGGPVVGRNGEFLGLAGAPLSSAPVMGRIFSFNELFRWQISLNSGVSTAARADRLRDALPALRRGESVASIGGAFLGVGQDPRTALSNTVRVGRIVRGSAAEKAGLKRGDVVVRMDGTPVKSWKHFVGLLRRHAPGDEVVLTVRRKEETMDVKVRLGERK